MPAKKPTQQLTEMEHYKLVDEKLAALMNAIPAPTKRESPSSSEDEEPTTTTWSQRVSAFYKAQKAKNPAYTFKQAQQDMKGK